MISQHSSRSSHISRWQFLHGAALSAGAMLAGGGVFAAGRDRENPRFAGATGFLDGELEAKTFPGAALVVTQHGETVLERYWGTYKDWEQRDVPCEAGMVNMLYSLSKLITSTVVVMAHQDSLFEYDAPVSRYIPEFVGGGKDKVHVRHLLTHSAGLGGVPLKAVDTEEKWEAAVKTLCAASVEWEPGSRTIYHGLTGHFLAAEVVRRTSGMKSWESICRERLFDPIGAKSLSFRKPGKDVPVALTPQSSQLVFKPDSPEFTLNNLEIAGHPAGGAFGTSSDILKVLQLHLKRGQWHGKTLIKPGALEEMHTVQYAAEIR
ncbi:MAG TPA: serine hydrolase domain-containing protein, partial [Isosphaeraceae bacterium]|nr:serine hydrolase domain-containing protein [Isosphaeraceae bacterium]